MRQAELRATIHGYLGRQHLCGRFAGAALVAERGQVIYEGGFGPANAEWDIPNAPDVRYRVGSITKGFTAALALRLVDGGQLALDGTIADYLPYYRPDTGGRVTVHQLLNHTSGIPSYTDQPDFGRQVSRRRYDVETFVREYCSGDLQFDPGDEFAYNNSGYFILGAIFEAITGQDYAAALRERLLGPLGLQDTGYDHGPPLLSRRAAGYDQDLAGYRNTAFLDMSLPHAAGAMYSTVRDLHRWDRALYSEGVVSPPSRAAMFTPGLGNYGYGWRIIRLRPENLDLLAEPVEASSDPDGTLLISHGGGINGFSAAFVRGVDEQRVVALLSNLGGAPVGKIAAGVLALMHGQPLEMPRQPAAPLLYPLLVSEGVDAALGRYRAWRAEEPARYDTGEGQLLALARHCQGHGRAAAAEKVLDAAVAEFPAADAPRIDLGRLLIDVGRGAEGAAALRRVLAASDTLSRPARRRLAAMVAAAERDS